MYDVVRCIPIRMTTRAYATYLEVEVEIVVVVVLFHSS